MAHFVQNSQFFFQNYFQATTPFKLLLCGSCRSSLQQLGVLFVVLQIYTLKVKLKTSWCDSNKLLYGSRTVEKKKHVEGVWKDLKCSIEID